MVIRQIKSYVFIIAGLLLNAFGWVAFLIPAAINGGGVTGLGALIYYMSDFPVGISVLIINLGLVLLGMKILGIRFALTSIFGILAISVFLLLLPKFITEGFVEDRFMSALIGGALAGAGIGIAISNGGNSGGTDIIALIVTKYRNISPGRVILFLDIIIIASSWFVNREIETIVYGYVVMAVRTWAMDLVMDGIKQSFQLTIISEKSSEIAQRIGDEIGRGITVFKGTGWYSKKNKEILMCACQRHDKQRIFRIINTTDPEAFITVAKVSTVFGKNFDRIKL